MNVETDSGLESDNAGDTSEPVTLSSSIEDAFEVEEISTEDGIVDDGNDEATTEEQIATNSDEPETTNAADENQVLAVSSWDEATKAAFGTLNDAGKQAMLSMSKNIQAGFTRKSQDNADKLRSLEAIEGTIPQALKDTLQAQNMSTSDGIGNLIGLYTQAQQDPVSYMQWFAQQNNIDLGNLTNQPPQDGNQEIDDPIMAQMQAQINSLTNHINTQEQTNFNHGQNELNNVITDFKNTQDTGGHLKYPHYDKVRNTMGLIMQGQEYQRMDNAAALDTAYQAAVYATKDLRDELQTTEVNKQLAEQAKKSNARKARRAATPQTSANAGTTKTGRISLSNAIDAAMNS